MDELLGLDGALSLDERSAAEMFSLYVNSGFKTLLSVVGFDRSFVRAEGTSLYDENGERYLDFLGGYGSLPFGHNPKRIIDAVMRVHEAMRPNFLHAQLSPLQAALAHDLAQVTPGDLQMTFFCNSGTEAVESGLKLARGAKGQGVFIHCTGAFHGKTLGSLSVGGREKYKKPFEPLLSGTVEIPFGDAEALERALSSYETAAFIVEPIQGEGGVVVPPQGYLREARELTRKHDALLILDEVQTGFGRTGTLFACEREGVVPDILCMAKALGGGVMPIGATIATRKVWEKAYGGLSRAVLHTSTFGGGALACAAGLASVNEIVSGKLWERAESLGNYFLSQLMTLKERYKAIQEVRGRGLLIGVEFKKPVGGLANALTGGTLGKAAEEYYASLVASELFRKHHILTAYTLNNPNVMRLEPPLIVEKEDIDRVLNAFEDVLSKNTSFLKLAVSAVTSKIHGGER